jgi:hypothetical protein
MKHRINILLFLFIGFVNFCCSNKKKEIFNNENCDTILPINVELDDDLISFYDIFDSISIIKLETSKESLINSIDKILFNKDTVFVMDKKQGCIFLFNSNGKYINKLSQQGNGPEEYFDLTDFTLNKKSNCIELLSAYRGIYSFDMDLKFINKVTLPDKIIPVHNFAIIDDNTRALYNTVRENRIELFNINSKTIKYFFKVPLYIYREASLGGSFTLENKEYGKAIFTQSFSNIVYSITNSKIVPLYKLDFNKYNFNINDIKPNLSQNEYDNIIRSSSFKDKHVYHFTANDYNSSIYLTQFSFSSKNELFTIIYNKSNNKYIKIKKFKEGVFFPYYPILTEDNIYAIANDTLVLNAYINSKIKEYNLITKNDLDHDMNPIVLKYKLKKH